MKMAARSSEADSVGHDAVLVLEIDPRLLEILVCPLTRSALEYDRAGSRLVSRQAGLVFPIREGIPIMLLDEASALD